MEKEVFMKAYSSVLRKVWSGDEDYKKKLLSNPSAVLKDAGLDPGTAKVNIITKITREGTLDDQLRLWEEGLKTGAIDLYVPLEQPEAVEDVDLTDAELESVAGGGDCCCTCTPCCCC
ncbi:MAG: hypothetical protein PHF66_12790 [Desulfobacteraceae bacterium]|jgi:hypothetical protein|nr:hypothetical protein [Desulfobacteraceae bacterium]MDD3993018.1 hypothetical protein [Desulfobacteraceae bacterium]